jgi:hypothetical protein
LGSARFRAGFSAINATSKTAKSVYDPFMGFFGKINKPDFCKTLEYIGKMERAKGFEPSTPTLARFGAMKMS